MKGKIFTIDEVNRMLPLVKNIVKDVITAYDRVSGNLTDYELAKENGATEEELDIIDKRIANSLSKLQPYVDELENLGCTVRDFQYGVIGFYGDWYGQIVYFCWKDGEELCTHYHNIEEDYTKRKPLKI